MNIFHTDKDPKVAALALDDLRLNKMIIESASLLANAIAFHGGSASDLPTSKTSGQPFKTKAWQNHPSCLWVKESRTNYIWLFEHMSSMIEELKHRKGTIHSMEHNLVTFTNSSKFIPQGVLTNFANCTPYKNITDTVQAYKMTMAYKWEHDAKVPIWTSRGKPAWYDQALITHTMLTQGEFKWTGQRLARSKRTEGWLTNGI